MMMTLLALFARISDPQFGGITFFMTLLNSVNNLGSSSLSTACLWLVDILTIKFYYNADKCKMKVRQTSLGYKIEISSMLLYIYFFLFLFFSLSVSLSLDTYQETAMCHTVIDGFYVEVITCSLIGALWLFWGKKQIFELEKLETGASIVKQDVDAEDLL